MKKFLISIDTEGDNLWKWSIGKPITSENAKYLPRFQELCEAYGFKPTYLTNYEMATDKFFADYFKKKLNNNFCEIGMHLHAWNSPPQYDLPVRTDIIPGAPFLVEYPSGVMNEKISYLTHLLENTFESQMITHRAGRWVINQEYLEMLDMHGYKVDCSVTPLIDWRKAAGQSPDSFGGDYSSYKKNPYKITGTDILEIPVTIRDNHRVKSLKGCGIRKSFDRIKAAKKGHGPLWMRPKNYNDNLDDLFYLTDVISKEKETDYLMFMLHSSEFMPAGSPSFPDEESIEFLYDNLEALFKYVSKNYTGCTFKEYYEKNR